MKFCLWFSCFFAPVASMVGNSKTEPLHVAVRPATDTDTSGGVHVLAVLLLRLPEEGVPWWEIELASAALTPMALPPEQAPGGVYPPPPCACTALSKHGVGVEPLF